MSYTVRIREVATGEERDFHSDGVFSSYQWREGNYACDCNRATFFGRAGGLGSEYFADQDCGETDYELVSVAGDVDEEEQNRVKRRALVGYAEQSIASYLANYGLQRWAA